MNTEKIALILVLYKLPPAESISLISLNNSARAAGLKLHVYIYDNSPLPHTLPSFSHLSIHQYYHNPKNAGVSAAYNYFAEKADENFQFLMLLDQDTEFPLTYVKELQTLNPQLADVWAPKLWQGQQLLSPHAWKMAYSYSLKNIDKGLHYTKGLSLLNSGILISREVFLKAGGYHEDVPLYFSDQLFIYKLKKSGLSHFWVLDQNCYHPMASNMINDEKMFQPRFQLYLNGAKQTRKHFPLYLRLFNKFIVVFRGIKLSLKFKTMSYLIASVR